MEAVAAAVAGATPVQLGVAVAAVLVTLVVYLVAARGCCGSGDRSDGGRDSTFGAGAGVVTSSGSKPSQRAAAETILLLGPIGAGKTVLLHRLMHGAVRSTVMSIHEGRVSGKLACQRDDGAARKCTMVDYPGALRSVAVEAAAACAGVIFVVDAAAKYDAASPIANHFKAAADLLYELLTAPGFADAATPLLVLCNKADVEGARSPDAVRAILETELERLKVSRPAVATAGDEGSQQAHLLGRDGARFSFAEDVPDRVQWVAAAATAPAPDGSLPRPLVPVADFVAHALARGR